MFTVGHSNHTLEKFLSLLHRHGVTTVVDIRSYPSSRHVPHFGVDPLRHALTLDAIAYVYLGRELGGRPRGRQFYDHQGRLVYARVTASPAFARGIERLCTLASRCKVALLCSEEDPAICHRRTLIGSSLTARGIQLHHIRGDGSVEPDGNITTRQPSRKSPRHIREPLRTSDATDAAAGLAPAACACDMRTLFTIGFTARGASDFFGALRTHGICRVLDVRLKNTSQLAGFTKKRDLPYFLKQLARAHYLHEPLLAPTSQLLRSYRQSGAWDEYATAFTRLLSERAVEAHLDRRAFGIPTALLCSEPQPDFCHRRLVAEYLQDRWGDIEIIHL